MNHESWIIGHESWSNAMMIQRWGTTIDITFWIEVKYDAKLCSPLDVTGCYRFNFSLVCFERTGKCFIFIKEDNYSMPQ